MWKDQNAFNSYVVDNGVIGFFDKPITLKSGRQSNWYVNWRKPSEDAFLLDTLSQYVLSFVAYLSGEKVLSVKPDTIYGVPEGASKVAVVSQLAYAKSQDNFSVGSHIVAMGRGKAKEHGQPQDRFFLGTPRGATIVLEDVTTTGGSLLNVLKDLRESDITVVATIGLTNRMEKRDDGLSVAEAIEKDYKVPYFHMSAATDLLPLVVKKLQDIGKTPSAELLASIEKEFVEVGVKQISF